MKGARPIRRLLVANRGEIAVRIVRACRALGIETVAVFSEADAGARHVRLADEAVPIGPAPARESYLRADKLVESARATHCDAIHPGFGFLSENPAFARAVEAAGLVWVGPPPSAIEAMGSKISSREIMRAAGVPVVPGLHVIQESPGVSSNERESSPPPFEEVRSLGFPVVVKASAGGGGKGMRVVSSLDDLPSALESCRREAEGAFGDGTVYVEKYLERPRHVEVQILGDCEGRIEAIGERECSLQRRHQKVIEESPSPAVGPELRGRLARAAVAAAKAVGYQSAGTVEFLLAAGGTFFFLEMNTRIQVEHPVTEEAFGVDLVALQLRIATGEPLPGDLPSTPAAHAMEARVYAEDTENGFLPQTGRILLVREPSGPGIRVDSALEEGDEVSIHYDPMLAKIVARGADREEARRRLVAALWETVILGVTTNVSYLRRVLESEDVVRGDMDTALLERITLPKPPMPDDSVFAAALAAFSSKGGTGGPERTGESGRVRVAADSSAAAGGGSFMDPFVAGSFRILR